MSDTAITQKLCNCPEFPGENKSCPVHYPMVSFDDVRSYALDKPLNVAELAYRTFNRELTPEHIIDAAWTIRNLYSNGNAPEWLAALAAGNPAEFEEVAEEVLDMLLLDIIWG